MTIKNGDIPAMPQDAGIWCERIGECSTLATGFTKREMIAMAAMQGLLSKHGDDDYSEQSIAKYAVEHADSLLAELERNK